MVYKSEEKVRDEKFILSRYKVSNIDNIDEKWENSKKFNKTPNLKCYTVMEVYQICSLYSFCILY